jgi:two-component system, OmpR family, phosphate regulon sensor histidine kinase PhoR
MDKRLNISKWLMYATVLVLVLFQGYWLRNVYRQTYRSLHREISVVLREAIVKDQMQLMWADTGLVSGSGDGVRVNGPVTIMRFSDSTLAKDAPKPSAKVEVKVTEGYNLKSLTAGDSGKRKDSRRVFSFDAEEEIPPSGKLIVNLVLSEEQMADTMAMKRYGALLEKARLPSAFKLKKSDKTPPWEGIRMRRFERPHLPGARMRFSFVLAELDFGNSFQPIMAKMYGQVLFSIFMTGMVILAFRFMYKSLKEGQKMALLKNDFISNMTHELKTPVATVSVAIEALKNFSAMDDPKRTREYLDISAAELNRLSLLIDKVLRINMFEADKLQMESQTIDLNRLTTEVVQSQQLQASRQGATISWQEPAGAFMVTGDKLHLMSVLYNLLDNALKYCDKQPQIEVGIEQSGNNILWKVKDNGPGIAAEYRTRIFEKFFRVPQFDRHDVKGYGLGLSYVHEVVQKHGGHIKVESEPGKGCTFIVTLPARVK